MAKRARDEAGEGAVATRAGLGDIMGHKDELSAPQTTLNDFTPLQRVVLSANGNLQRLLSSYHNSAVTVTARYSRVVAKGLVEREVELSVHGIVFAVATSTVRLSREDLIEAVEQRGLAIGQLFRHLNVMPTFELHAAEHLAPGALAVGEPSVPRFSREYELSGDGVHCEIREVLRADLFELRPETAVSTRVLTGASMGDIMAPNVTFLPLPDGFTPLQRLLLTANGNLERLLSSYYAKPLSLYVSLNHKRAASVYDRQVVLLHDGRQLMLAKTTVFITDPSWQAAVDAGCTEVGGLFRHFSVLPTFTLHSTGHAPEYFWRQYQLQASGMTCEINETFPKAVLDGMHEACSPKQIADGCQFGGF